MLGINDDTHFEDKERESQRPCAGAEDPGRADPESRSFLLALLLCRRQRSRQCIHRGISDVPWSFCSSFSSTNTSCFEMLGPLAATRCGSVLLIQGKAHWATAHIYIFQWHWQLCFIVTVHELFTRQKQSFVNTYLLVLWHGTQAAGELFCSTVR